MSDIKRRGNVDPVEREELDCLIMWPRGCNGWYEESRTLDILLELCKKQGFGRIPQLASQIEKIWRNPESVENFKSLQKEHLEFIESCRKFIEENEC